MFDVASLRALSVDTLLAVAIGLLLLVLALALLDKTLPFSLKTAISGQRNDAVSVLIFSVLLGLGIIVSATLHTGSDEAHPASDPAAASTSGAPASRPVPTHR